MRQTYIQTEKYRHRERQKDRNRQTGGVSSDILFTDSEVVITPDRDRRRRSQPDASSSLEGGDWQLFFLLPRGTKTPRRPHNTWQ